MLGDLRKRMFKKYSFATSKIEVLLFCYFDLLVAKKYFCRTSEILRFCLGP